MMLVSRTGDLGGFGGGSTPGEESPLAKLKLGSHLMGEHVDIPPRAEPPDATPGGP